MKLFSLKPVIEIVKEGVLINDLAYNHKTTKEGQLLKVEQSFDNVIVKAFFNKKGVLQKIRHQSEHFSKALLPWKLEHKVVKEEKQLASGNVIRIESVYDTTDAYKNKLVKKLFASIVDKEEVEVEFRLVNGKWISNGTFPENHRKFWLKN